MSIDKAEKAANKQRVIGRPFKKGQSGNPKGKPPGTFSMLTLLKKELQKIHPTDEFKRTHGELVVQSWLRQAIAEGNQKAIRDIMEYVEGKPVQPLEHSGKDGGAINLNIDANFTTRTNPQPLPPTKATGSR